MSVLLVGAGLISYSGWLLEFVIPTGVSPVRDPVDALLGGPLVFRIVLAVSGVAFLLAGPPLRRIAPVQWQSRIGAMSVSVFGALVVGYAAIPGNPVLSVLINGVFVVGAASLVLWWPPGWRALAVAGLVVVLLTWAALVLARQLDTAEGVVSRVEQVVRAVLYAVGGTYAFVKPAPRHTPRGGL